MPKARLTILVGRQQTEESAASHDVPAKRHGHDEPDDVQGRAAVDDQRHEPEVVSQPPQQRRESPQAGFRRPQV